MFYVNKLVQQEENTPAYMGSFYIARIKANVLCL